MSLTQHRKWLRTAIVLVGLVSTALLGKSLIGMERINNSPANFWNALKEASKIIKVQADSAIRKFGYNPKELTGIAVATAHGEYEFGGDETWLVRYWYKKPADSFELAESPGDIRVYLNDRGTVRRVEIGHGNDRKILMGRDLSIKTGMTASEVLERLGEPDVRKAPPKQLQHHGDIVWIYKANASRRIRIEIYFAKDRVTSATIIGVDSFPINKTLLEEAYK